MGATHLRGGVLLCGLSLLSTAIPYPLRLSLCLGGRRSNSTKGTRATPHWYARNRRRPALAQSPGYHKRTVGQGMANPEHVATFAKGVTAWNAWRRSRPKVAPDLSGANLSVSELRGVNLGLADLERVQMPPANLEKADLSDANLRGANLNEARVLGGICAVRILARPASATEHFARATSAAQTSLVPISRDRTLKTCFTLQIGIGQISPE